NGVDDILSKEEWGGGTGRGISLRLEDRRPEVNFGSGPEWLTLRAPQPAETGKWMHLVGVYDGEHQALFIDGVEVSSMACSKAISVSPQPIRIGRGPFAQERRFKGIIDEVALFDLALTAEEIRLTHQLGSGGKPLSK
ncbi:MAG TPA: LamG domain-containing protein, partial [Pirellulaceae bacterium]|nr:LamG domain-containing protein [Pirellulaceae bacterium]